MKDRTVLVFDFFGVLCAEIFELWMEKSKLQDRRSEAKEIIKLTDLGKITTKDECERLGRMLGKTGETVFMELTREIKMNLELIDFISKNQANYRMALLSNSNADLVWPILEKYNLVGKFEQTFISSETGFLKPGIDCYLNVAKKLGVRQETCILIDDREKNIWGAKMAGMNGILYKF